MAPSGLPGRVGDGRGHGDIAVEHLLVSDGEAIAADRRQTRQYPAQVRHGMSREGAPVGSAEDRLGFARVQPREHGKPRRRAKRGQARSHHHIDIEDIAAEEARDEDDLLAVEQGQIGRLAASLVEMEEIGHRPLHQFAGLQIAPAELQGLRTQRIEPAGLVPPKIAQLQQRIGEALGRAQPHPRSLGDLRQAEPAAAAVEGAQDLERLVDGIDHQALAAARRRRPTAARSACFAARLLYRQRGAAH